MLFCCSCVLLCIKMGDGAEATKTLKARLIDDGGIDSCWHFHDSDWLLPVE
jgi:hypothetical protein